MDRNELINLLINHVDQIVAIQHTRNYVKAEELYQRTKTIASKYFPNEYYKIELVSVDFKPIGEGIWTSEADYKIAWHNGIVKINSISKAMIDHLKLPSIQVPNIREIEQANKIKAYEKKLGELESKYEEIEKVYTELRSQYSLREARITKMNKIIVFSVLLIFLSFFLWTFNTYVHWEWLTKHPKKIPLYISFQLLILFSLLRIITKNKIIKSLDWVIAIIITVLSIL